MTLPDRNLKSPNPPSPEPGTILVRTERLIIRRLQYSDAPAMAAAADHKAVFNNVRDRLPSPYTLADAESYISSIVARKTPYPCNLGVFLLLPKTDCSPEDAQLIGAMGVELRGDVEYRTWEIGYWLTPSAWGQGYATEAVGAFVPWMFETWPTLNRIEADVYLRNEGSARVLTKSGFTREGVRRGCAEKNGVVMDQAMFGIVRSDIGL